MARSTGTGLVSGNRASIARLLAQLDGVSPEAIAKADTRALASVRRRMEPVTKRVIRQAYNVKAGELSGKFRLRQSGDALELYATTAGVPLDAFGGRWRGPARRKSGQFAPPATAEILRGNRKSYPSAFMATINGTRGIYVRQYSRDARSASGRDPRNKLRRLRGPSVFQMTQGLGDVNAALIVNELNTYRASEIARQLQLARKGR